MALKKVPIGKINKSIIEIISAVNLHHNFLYLRKRPTTIEIIPDTVRRANPATRKYSSSSRIRGLLFFEYDAIHAVNNIHTTTDICNHPQNCNILPAICNLVTSD